MKKLHITILLLVSAIYFTSENKALSPEAREAYKETLSINDSQLNC